MVLTTSMPFPAREETTRSIVEASHLQPGLSKADAEARRISACVSRGDESAFRELYDRFHTRLFRFAVVLGHGDQALAHDVVQRVMLTAARKLKPVESEAHLWNWMALVARQHLSKAWQNRKRQPAMVNLDDVPESADATEADPALQEKLDEALVALDQEDRRAVEWFYFDGLSHKEIAGRLNTTPKAVSSRLERARVKLRSMLNQMSHET